VAFPGRTFVEDGVTEEVGGPAVGGGVEVGGSGRLGVQRVEE
jgi:hypothetical protein